MKKSLLYTLVAAEGVLLASCVYTPAVPDMPYRGSFRTPARPAPAAQPAAPEIPAPQAASAAAAALAPTPAAPAIPPAVAAPATAPLDLTKPPVPKPAVAAPAVPAATPAPAVAPAAPQAPAATPPVKPASAPAATPAPAPAPASQPPVATDPKLITNTGSIPYATPVEGDPTRVYNPLDPSKKIRIIDKNGNRYPSGKELKVRGTNYHFYVP